MTAKSWRLRWHDHVVGQGIQIIGVNSLQKIRHGRQRRGWDNNIKLHVMVVDYEDWRWMKEQRIVFFCQSIICTAKCLSNTEKQCVKYLNTFILQIMLLPDSTVF